MQPQFFRTNDGVKLKFTDDGPREAPALVLLHGWSANGEYFSRNVPELAETLRVVTVDHRGMGRSEKPGHGSRVSRISADVRDLLDHLDTNAALSQKVVMCGCSLGFTIISLYLEMFGSQKVSGVSFVDQSAAMYHRGDWCHGAPGLSNPAMCETLVAMLRLDFPSVVEGTVEGGYGEVGPTDEESAFMREQVSLCDADFLVRLMQDHANLDMRDFLPKIEVPVLNFIGGATKCHHKEGISYIGDHVAQGRNVEYDGYGHFLYWEAPRQFNADIREFVLRCHGGKPS